MIPNWVVVIFKYKTVIHNLVECRCAIFVDTIFAQTLRSNADNIIPFEHARIFVLHRWRLLCAISGQILQLLILGCLIQLLKIDRRINLFYIHRCRIRIGCRSFHCITFGCRHIIWLHICIIQSKCHIFLSTRDHRLRIPHSRHTYAELVHRKLQHILVVEQLIRRIHRASLHIQQKDGNDAQTNRTCHTYKPYFHLRLVKFYQKYAQQNKCDHRQHKQQHPSNILTDLLEHHDLEIHCISGAADRHQTQECPKYPEIDELHDIIHAEHGKTDICNDLISDARQPYSECR